MEKHTLVVEVVVIGMAHHMLLVVLVEVVEEVLVRVMQML
jgi:hypothetical protein